MVLTGLSTRDSNRSRHRRRAPEIRELKHMLEYLRALKIQHGVDTLRDLPDAFVGAAGPCKSAQYPSELEGRMTLPNGNWLRIRPLRPSEGAAIREFYRRLTLRTRRLRLLSPSPDLSDSALNLITSVDYCRRLALLAESDMAHREEIVAVSEFAALDDHTAEVALVVSDEWQRLGLGTALAARTLLAAEARGFDLFVAQVFCDNVGVMRLLDHVAAIVSMQTRRGVSEITFVPRTRRRSP